MQFDIPAFAGSVRVMAVAWTKDKVGKASGDVVVRDPVVLTATLPRFLRTGDRGAVQLELDNVEGAAGDYNLAVATDGAAKLDGTQPQALKLAAKQRDRVSIPVTASGAGPSTVTVKVSGPDNFALERSYALDVRPATQILTRRTVRALAKGETLTLSKDLFADFVPGTGRVGLSVAVSTSLDAATLLNALDRYPFGCSEQIASRAMAMLYVNELAAQAQLAPDGDVDQRIRDAIPRLLARQGSNGSFGLWSVGGDDPWLDAYVTDFLTRARARGFDVPQTAYTLAIDRLAELRRRPRPSHPGTAGASSPMRSMCWRATVPRRSAICATSPTSSFPTSRRRSQKRRLRRRWRWSATRRAPITPILRRSMPLRRSRSSILDAPISGQHLRDAAALVTLASEGRAPQKTIDDAVLRIDTARTLAASTSTQENAWLVLAARALAKQLNSISLNVNGETRQGALYRNLRPDDLASSYAVQNNGDGNVQAVVSVSGSPLTPEPAAESGFKIERSYHTLAGEAADPSKARQNQRFVVVLKVTEPQPQFGRVIVADYLPAGFEIDNPRLVSSGETGTLDWIADGGRAGEQRIPRRPLHRSLRPGGGLVAGLYGCLCRACGVAGAIRAAAGESRGHVSA